MTQDKSNLKCMLHITHFTQVKSSNEQRKKILKLISISSQDKILEWLHLGFLLKMVSNSFHKRDTT